MTPNETAPVATEEVVKPVEVTSEEKKEINVILAAQEKYPPATNFSRNNVTAPLVPRPYGRGNRKSYGCKYLGIPKEFFTEENLPKLYDLIGPDKVLTLFESFLNQIGVASTENAIDDNGNFNIDLVIKGFVEFSSRGEPSSDLRERLDNANEEFNKYKADPDFVNYWQMGTDGKPKYPAQFKDIMRITEEITYCGGTIMERKRKKKEVASTVVAA